MVAKRKIDWLNHGLEFIIVVAGILLAFQLNTCSEEKKQRRVVKQHLVNIEEETVFNLASLERSINQGKVELQNIDSMINLVNRGTDLPAINTMSFQLLNIGRVYFQKNSYNTLTASGDIRYIHDFQLKEDIIDLYEYYNWTEAVDKINLDFYIKNYYPYIMNNFDMLQGTLQPKELYTSKLLKNILSGYSFQIKARINKYDDFHKTMLGFMNSRGWGID